MQKVHQDVITSVALMLVSVFLFFQTFDFMPQSASFPRILLSLLVILSIFVFVSGIKKTKTMHKGIHEERESDEDLLSIRLLTSPVITLFSVVLYVIVIQVVGFFLSTLLFLTGFLFVMKIKNWKTHLFTVIGITLFIYLIFVQQLNVQLPAGMLFE